MTGCGNLSNCCQDLGESLQIQKNESYKWKICFLRNCLANIYCFTGTRNRQQCCLFPRGDAETWGNLVSPICSGLKGLLTWGRPLGMLGRDFSSFYLSSLFSLEAKWCLFKAKITTLVSLKGSITFI